MAKSKTKESKKAQPAAPLAVKKAGVTKASQTPKAKSKEVAKVAAKKVVKEKEPSKKKKAPEPESSEESEDSEEEDKADSSDSDSDSESEEEEKPAKKAAANSKAKAAAPKGDRKSVV